MLQNAMESVLNSKEEMSEKKSFEDTDMLYSVLGRMRTHRLCPLPTPSEWQKEIATDELVSYLYCCDGRPICGCEERNCASDKQNAILSAKNIV